MNPLTLRRNILLVEAVVLVLIAPSSRISAAQDAHGDCLLLALGGEFQLPFRLRRAPFLRPRSLPRPWRLRHGHLCRPHRGDACARGDPGGGARRGPRRRHHRFFLCQEKGGLFCPLTLAFNQFLWAAAWKWRAVTGGDDGIGNLLPDKPVNLGFVSLDLNENNAIYYFTWSLSSFAWRLGGSHAKHPLAIPSWQPR